MSMRPLATALLAEDANDVRLNRRTVLVGLGLPFLLAACQSSSDGVPTTAALPGTPAFASMYAEADDNGFHVPAIDLSRADPTFLRRSVPVPAGIPAEPNSIVIDPGARFLYLINADGRSAIRYGIGVGREGFAWNGEATIEAKREWPKWFPPPEMVARDPKAAPWAGGMPGGLNNPLGARALYLYQGGKDTLYRIHGTNEPWSIGKAVSSGCIRMMNQDVMDLFSRVPLGTKVTVLSA
jgi:lipoprotein-anchoring transpeptidase ErfK/SrfK